MLSEKEFIIQRKEDLTSNPTPRIAVVLCLDNSGSMANEPIKELNEGIRVFYNAILEDEVACYSVEVCVVSFDYEAVVVQDFCDINKQTIPQLSTRRGKTHIGEGVNLALDMLECRKAEYQDSGVDYYQPWLVLMTDGMPDGEPESITRAAMNRTSQMVKNRKLTVFPIGIGPNADKNTLKGFSPNRDPLKLQGLNFKEFFEWLSKSVGQVSVSTPGNGVKLPPLKGLTGWDSIDI